MKIEVRRGNIMGWRGASIGDGGISLINLSGIGSSRKVG